MNVVSGSTEIGLSIGQAIEFSYPLDNRLGVLTRFSRRRFVIEFIRDTNRYPIETWAIKRRPNLRRGRFLLTGHDLDSHERRSFYLDSARRLITVNCDLYRLALVDPVSGQIADHLDTIYAGNSADMKLALATILEFNRRVEHRPKIVHTLALMRYEPETSRVSR